MTGKKRFRASLKLSDVPSWNTVLELWRRAQRLYRQGKISLRNLCLLGVLFTTGARISEILSLRVEDINFSEGIIRIRQLKKRRKGQETVIREVPLHPDVKPYLYRYVQELKRGDKLFPISRQQAYNIVHGFTGFRPHAFRHAVAIRMLEQTRDLELVRRVLGHEDYSVLKVYLDFTLRDRRTEIETALKLG